MLEFSSGNKLLYLKCPHPLTELFTCFPIEPLSQHSQMRICTSDSTRSNFRIVKWSP